MDSVTELIQGRKPRRVVVTGPVGVEKGPFLNEVVRLARSKGFSARVFHVGDMMYGEAPDVAPGRILDLPLARLTSLRRGVFKEILTAAHNASTETTIINTHAAFRWRHGLFPAFDHDQMVSLDADLYVTLVDNVDAVHERLQREHSVHHTIKDVLVWREEEILATEILAGAVRGHGCFYVIARGNPETTVLTLQRLIFEPEIKRVYPSFPMTHVVDVPEALVSINRFRKTLAEHFTAFDPADLDEKWLLFEARLAQIQGRDTFSVDVHGRQIQYRAQEILDVAKDIDAQIYARDFKLIDQSDMIISYIPKLPDGKPALSSGVERELQHAHEATKDVFVIWESQAEPSPFVTATASEVFPDLASAMRRFRILGYLSHEPNASDVPTAAATVD